MFTLSQIINEIQTFATNHKQLKSFHFGFLEDFDVDKSKGFPALIVTPAGGSRADQQKSNNLQFIVCDLLKTDVSNQLEVLSDTDFICDDLLAYMDQSSLSSLILDKNVTLNVLFHKFPADSAGYGFDLTFRQIFDWSICAVPVTILPAFTNNQIVTIKDQNGTVLATLNPGSSYTVEVLQQLIQTLTDPAPSTIIQTLT